jgi:hypothetical protein
VASSTAESPVVELPCPLSLPDVEFDGLVVFDDVEVLVELAGGVAFFDGEFVGFHEI